MSEGRRSSGDSEHRRHSPDVVVIGGGIAGVSTALELVRAGAATVLVDDQRPGRATAAGAGILSPATSIHTDDPWLQLADAAGRRYPALAESLEAPPEDDHGYSRCSLLELAMSEGELPYLEQVQQQAERRYPGQVVELGVDDARTLFPPLGEPMKVIHDPRAARLDGRRFSRALSAAALRLGLEVLHQPARGLSFHGDRVRAVRLSSGELPCGAAVICGGAWSPELLGPRGVTLPVTPMKGQIVHLHLPGTETDRWPIVQPVLGHYLVSWPGGRVACGGTLEPEAGFDTASTVRGVRQLLRACVTLAPGLANAAFGEVRVGLRPTTPDDRPVIGLLPGTGNVWLCTGHGTDGLLLGPVSGLLASCLALALPLPPDLSTLDIGAFGPERFSAPRPT